MDDMIDLGKPFTKWSLGDSSLSISWHHSAKIKSHHHDYRCVDRHTLRLSTPTLAGDDSHPASPRLAQSSGAQSDLRCLADDKAPRHCGAH